MRRDFGKRGGRGKRQDLGNLPNVVELRDRRGLFLNGSTHLLLSPCEGELPFYLKLTLPLLLLTPPGAISPTAFERIQYATRVLRHVRRNRRTGITPECSREIGNGMIRRRFEISPIESDFLLSVATVPRQCDVNAFDFFANNCIVTSYQPSPTRKHRCYTRGILFS